MRTKIMFKIEISNRYVKAYNQYIANISKYSTEFDEETLYNDGIYAFLTYLDEQISLKFDDYQEITELIVEDGKSFIEVPNFKGSDFNTLNAIVENCFSVFQQSMKQNKNEIIAWLRNEPNKFKNIKFYLIVLEILGLLED